MFKTTMFDNYVVRKAEINNYNAIVEILKAAAKWVQSKGIKQWGYLLDGGEDQEIKADILAGDTYIVENENKEIVATFNFSNTQNDWDLEMWGKRTDNALYIHRLAVHENYHHKQIGKRLLSWIDENLQLTDGYIRLDCVGNNPKLNNFYKEAGFKFVQYVGEGDDRFSLYEKAF